MLFKKIRERKIEKILEKIDNKDLTKRYFLLALGCLTVAFALIRIIRRIDYKIVMAFMLLIVFY